MRTTATWDIPSMSTLFRTRVVTTVFVSVSRIEVRCAYALCRLAIAPLCTMGSSLGLSSYLIFLRTPFFHLAIFTPVDDHKKIVHTAASDVVLTIIVSDHPFAVHNLKHLCFWLLPC